MVRLRRSLSGIEKPPFLDDGGVVRYTCGSLARRLHRLCLGQSAVPVTSRGGVRASRLVVVGAGRLWRCLTFLFYVVRVIGPFEPFHDLMRRGCYLPSCRFPVLCEL